jgi:hypothetical protein
MFCPNCSASNNDDQHFCRSCGLKLDAIVMELAEQRPSPEYAELMQKVRRFEKLGVASLTIFALIGLALLFSKVFYYKLILFGPEVLFWAATIAMIAFGLLSVFLFNYPKFGIKLDKVNPRLPIPVMPPDRKATTKKLLADPPFEPASVTEHSTELLRNRR